MKPVNRIPVALIVAVCLTLWACTKGNPANPGGCNVTLVKISPLGSTVKTGDSIQFTAIYVGPSECLPNVPVTGLRWRSSVPLVATVDSTTGLAVAVSTGTAGISVHAPASASDLATIGLIVLPR